MEDSELRERFDRIDQRFDWFMTAVTGQFEAQQKYMDRRFNEILEAMDIGYGNHERRIKRLEHKVLGS